MQLMPWIRPTRLAVFLTHAILWYFPFLIPTFHCEIYPARRQSDEIWGKRNIIWSFKKFPKFESLLRYDIRRLQKSFEPTNNFRLLVFKRQFILSLVIHRRTRWPLFDIFIWAPLSNEWLFIGCNKSELSEHAWIAFVSIRKAFEKQHRKFQSRRLLPSCRLTCTSNKKQ